MPLAVQLDASDAYPLDEVRAAGTHELLFESEDEATLEVVRRRFQGAVALEPTRGCRRLLVALEGEGHLRTPEQESAVRLRLFDPLALDAATPAELTADGAGPLHVLELLADDELADVHVTALRLGERTIREALSTGAAFVHAAGGALVVRATDEEEPFELAAGESLWLDELEGDEELELAGRDAALCAVLVQLRRR